MILANAARMLGIEANIFFTFWGMDIITKSKVDNLKVTPVGNTAMHMPQFVGGLPGMTDMAADMMHLTKDDMVEEVDEILGAMEFLEMSEERADVVYLAPAYTNRKLADYAAGLRWFVC